MHRLCFVIPAHGRLPLARICLAHLAEVCSEVQGTAVVLADDENFAVARRLGLQVLRRPNEPLGRKLNDGLEYAAREAPYVMPIGTDDLIAPELVQRMIETHEGLGDPDAVACVREMATIDPTGSEINLLRVPYEGGPGVRLYPSEMIVRAEGRPAEEDRMRALDGSVQRGLAKVGPLRFLYVESDPLELVDVKTAGENLNTYEMLLPYASSICDDPWEQLRSVYPAVTVDALESLYERTP